MTLVLYDPRCCPHSWILFLRYHNLLYLWSVFSMTLIRYFLRKGTLLVFVDGETSARRLSLCLQRRRCRAGRVGRTYWLSSSVQINCTCVCRVQQIKEPKYFVISTKGLNKFECVLICCSASADIIIRTVWCSFKNYWHRHQKSNLLYWNFIMAHEYVACYDVRSFVLK